MKHHYIHNKKQSLLSPLYYIDIQKKVVHPGRVGLTVPYMKRGQQKLFTMKFSETHQTDLLWFYASSCSCESGLGGRPSDLHMFFSSSGNSLGSTMFSGWNRIWNRNSAFQSAISASCDQSNKINRNNKLVMTKTSPAKKVLLLQT